MISTAIYVRVSTEEQARDGYSIRAQEEKLRQYAALKDWHIYGVYADEGISGKDIDGRPAVKQMLNDVLTGMVNNVLVYKIDRLTRSTKNLIELVELFNKEQCAFNSLVESIDTGSATGRMFLKIVGIFAEFERENLAERVRLGLERKVREGYGLTSYGQSYGYYREDGNKIQEIDSEEAAIVRRIFNMYLLDDYAFHKIARTLNAEQIPTKKGCKWDDTTIKHVLQNPNYSGKVRYSLRDPSRYFEAAGRHEPIIEEDTFNRVQSKIAKIKKVTRTKRPTSSVYFCGVLYCPKCGGKYTSKWSNNYPQKQRQLQNGGEYTSYTAYRCTNSIKYKCDNKSLVNHPKLEQAFEQYLTRIADFTEAQTADFEEARPPDNSAEIAAINAELGVLEHRTKEVMTLFMSGAVTFEEYQGMFKVGNERRGELQERLKALENAQAQPTNCHTKAEILANFKENWLVMDNEQRQQFVQQFIKKIVAHSEAINGKRHRSVVIDGSIEFNEF